MLLIKIGGGRSINIDGIAEDLLSAPRPAVIVHGANAWRDELARTLGITLEVVTSLKGYDSVLSTDTTIDLQLMAYAGLRNKRLVESLQRRQIPAIGLTGLDGRAIQGKRNAGIPSRQGNKVLVRHDLSGKPQQLNTRLLNLLLANGFVPVLTVPICDEEGYAINTDNDDVVALLHRELQATTVVSLLEAPGFLADADNPDSLLPRMSLADVREWEHRSSSRMRRKLHAICRLMENSPTTVIIADGRGHHPLRDALAGKGTIIA